VPVAPEAIERRIAFMNAAFGDALVTGYDSLVAQMGNDPKDRHVPAAAVAAGARKFAATARRRVLPLDDVPALS
jgi:hypothetical protein